MKLRSEVRSRFARMLVSQSTTLSHLLTLDLVCNIKTFQIIKKKIIFSPNACECRSQQNASGGRSEVEISTLTSLLIRVSLFSHHTWRMWYRVTFRRYVTRKTFNGAIIAAIPANTFVQFNLAFDKALKSAAVGLFITFAVYL